MPTTSTPTHSAYNVHRWYQPGVGTYTRLDPIGLGQEYTSYYGYAAGNPLLHTDPMGLLVIDPDVNCSKRKLNRAVDILRNRMPQECLCTRFFSNALESDLQQLLDGPRPVLRTFGSASVDAGTGGFTACDGSGEINIATFHCRKANAEDLAQAILHELGHFADCPKQNFPPFGPIEEGGLAELHCFGTKTDTKPVVSVPFGQFR